MRIAVRRFGTAAGLLVALLALPTASFAAEPLDLVNASFEDEQAEAAGPAGAEWTRGGGPPGWHCWIGSIARTGKPQLQHERKGGRDDTRCVSLSGCIGPVCVIQSVPVTAGDTYVCTAWARATNPKATTKLSVRWQNADGKWTNNESASDALPISASPASWHELSVPFDVPDGAAFAVMLLTASEQSDKDTCWFDDVSMDHVGPEDVLVGPCGWLHPNCAPCGEPVETPHVKWAKPRAGPKLKVLFVLGNDHNLREHIEVAQRLDIEHDWIFVHDFDTALYGLDNKTVMRRLDSGYYDVTVVATKAKGPMIRAFTKRCSGVVLVGFRHPTVRTHPDGTTQTGWWSMLPDVPEDIALTEAVDGSFLAEPLDAVPDVPLVGDRSVHRVDWGVPADGKRLARAVFNTRFYCLTPVFGFDDHLRLGHGYWEAYHQLLIRAILWAAAAEGPVRVACTAGANSATFILSSPAPVDGTLETWVCEQVGAVFMDRSDVRLAPGQDWQSELAIPEAAASGPAMVGGTLRDASGKALGFAITRLEVQRSPRIASVRPQEPYFIDAPTGQACITLEGAVDGNTLVVSLTDAWGRRHCEVRPPASTGATVVQLPLSARLSNFNWLDAALLSDTGKQLDTARWYLLAPLPRETFLDEFQIGTWACSSFMPQYLRPALHELMKQAGLTEGLQSRSGCLSMLAAGLWPISTAGRVPGFVRWDQDDTVRRPCLSDPENRKAMAARARASAETDRGVCPLFLYLQDETSLVKDSRDLDVCSCEHCQARYRTWLQQRYATIEALNRAWRTDYGAWNDIGFATYADVRGTDTFAPWLMYRRFMDWTWAEGIEWAKKNAREADPELLVAMPNTFGPNPFSGRDYYQLAQVNDYRMEYARETRSTRGNGFYDVLRSLAPGVRDHPWVGYRFDDETIRFAPWWTAFHGAAGFSVYGTMSFFAGKNSWAQIFPTLQHTPRGLLYADQARELRAGIGKILLDSKRAQAPIAILWSQPGMLVAWALSGQTGHPMSTGTENAYGRFFTSRETFRQAIVGSGRQFDYVVEEQIAGGVLNGYSCLVLPAAYALGEGTVEQLRQFLAGGGTVIADMGAGLTNGVGALRRDAAVVQDLFGIKRAGDDAMAYEKFQVSVVLAPGSTAAELAVLGREALTAEAGTDTQHYRDGQPAVITKRHGPGRTVFLNFVTGDHEQLSAVFSPFARVAQVETVGTGETPSDHEAVLFDMGRNQYVGITHCHLNDMPNPELVSIRLPRRAHLYDVRAGTYLGRTDRIETRLAPGDAAFYALLDYQISAVEVRTRQRQGAPYTVHCQLRTAAARVGDHIIHVQVKCPDGAMPPAYQRNVNARAGEAEFSIPLALNDPPGEWTVVCRDVATGTEGQVKMAVRVP